MSIIVKVSEWGNSLAIRLPKAVADQLGLRAGDEAEVELKGAKAILSSVQPAVKARMSIGDMIAEMRRLKATGVAEPELVDWGLPVGEEVLPEEDWSKDYAAWQKEQRSAG